MIRTLIAATTLIFLPGLTPANPGTPVPGTSGDDAQEFTLRSDVRLVLLDVSVRDRSGKFMPDLTKANFTVSEDGKPQHLTVFAHEDLPVNVGILMDESGSMRPKRGEVLEAALDFVDESNPQDEMFVLNFNDQVYRGLPDDMRFSNERSWLRAALRRGLPQGKTALNDAVVDGLDQLREGHRNKKALLLISDGGDNASTHSRREVMEMAERSAATIYTIGLYEEGDPDRDPGLLRHLAEISGGLAYFPEKPDEMAGICEHIAKDLRLRYTVGYVPRADSSRNALRHIHVQVTVPGHEHLTVLARKTYRYDDLPIETRK